MEDEQPKVSQQYLAVVGDRGSDRFSLVCAILRLPQNPPVLFPSYGFPFLYKTQRRRGTLLVASGDDTTLDVEIKISISSAAANEPVFSDPPIRSQISNSNDLIGLISKAAAQIQVFGNNIGLQQIALHVTVHGQSLPDLSLVDIPVQDHLYYPEMSSKVLHDPDVVLLVVPSSLEDLKSSPSLRLAQETDPKASRTMLVLLCEDQSLPSPQQISFPCPLGCVFIDPSLAHRSPTKGSSEDKATLSERGRASRLNLGLFMKGIPFHVGVSGLLQALLGGRTLGKEDEGTNRQTKSGVTSLRGVDVDMPDSSETLDRAFSSLSAGPSSASMPGKRGQAQDDNLGTLADVALAQQLHKAYPQGAQRLVHGQASQRDQGPPVSSLREHFSPSSVYTKRAELGAAGGPVLLPHMPAKQGGVGGAAAISVLDDETLVRALLTGPHSAGPDQFPLEDSVVRMPQEPLPGPQYALQRSARNVEESRVDVQRTFSRGGVSGAGTFTWMDRQRTYFHASLSSKTPRWKIRRQSDRDSSKTSGQGSLNEVDSVQCTIKKTVLRYREGDSFGPYRLEEYSLESADTSGAESAVIQLIRDAGGDWNWVVNQLKWHERDGFWVRRVIAHITPWPLDSDAYSVSRKGTKRKGQGLVQGQNVGPTIPPSTSGAFSTEKRSGDDGRASVAMLERLLKSNPSRGDTPKQSRGSPAGPGAQGSIPKTGKHPKEKEGVRDVQIQLQGLTSVDLTGRDTSKVKVQDPSAMHDVRSEAGGGQPPSPHPTNGWRLSEMALHSAFSKRLREGVRALEALREAGTRDLDRQLSMLILGSPQSSKQFLMDSLLGFPFPVPRAFQGQPRGVSLLAVLEDLEMKDTGMEMDGCEVSVSWQEGDKIALDRSLPSFRHLPGSVASFTVEDRETSQPALSRKLTIKGPGLPTITLVNLPDLDTSIPTQIVTRHIRKHYRQGSTVCVLVISALELLASEQAPQPWEPWTILSSYGQQLESSPTALVITEVDSVEFGEDVSEALDLLRRRELSQGFRHLPCFVVCNRRDMKKGMGFEEGRTEEERFLAGHPVANAQCEGLGIGPFTSWICKKLEEGLSGVSAALVIAMDRDRAELQRIPPLVNSSAAAKIKCLKMAEACAERIRVALETGLGESQGVQGLKAEMKILRSTLDVKCARIVCRDTFETIQRKLDGGVITLEERGELLNKLVRSVLSELCVLLLSSAKTCVQHGGVLLKEASEAACGKSTRLAFFIQTQGDALLESVKEEVVRGVSEVAELETRFVWGRLGSDPSAASLAQETFQWLVGWEGESKGVLEASNMGHMEECRISAEREGVMLQSEAGSVMEEVFSSCWASQKRIADCACRRVCGAIHKTLVGGLVDFVVPALEGQDYLRLLNSPEEEERIECLTRQLDVLGLARERYEDASQENILPK